MILSQANIQIQGCDQISVSTTATGTTSYGIPEPVMNAKVVDDNSSNCIIQWEHIDSDLDLPNYSVKYKSFLDKQKRLFA